MKPVPTPRRPPHRKRPRAGRPAPAGRVVLGVELLEGRLQPSFATLQSALPPALAADAGVVSTVASDAPADTTGPAATDASTDRPTVADRVCGFDVADDAVPSDLLSVPGQPAAPRRELVLVGCDVPDRDELVRDLLALPGGGTAVEVIGLRGGGVEEVTDVLRRHPGVDAIHLVTHGADGVLDLGAERLTSEALDPHAADLRAWGAALKPGGDLLLYGCDVAATAAGRDFVTRLSSLTGADVAASADPTGDAALGGNWELEFAAGAVDARPLAAAGWSHTLAAVVVSGPANGTLAPNADGSFTYTPAPGFVGTDTFTYRTTDPAGAASGLATVSLRVLPPNGRPVAAGDDAYTVAAGGVLDVPAGGVLANDTGSGTGPLTAAVVSGPANGTLTLYPDGSFTYVPGPGFAGTDSFDYKATDAGGTTATARVTLTVTAVNLAPAGAADTYETTAGQPLATSAPGVLANDADPDGDGLTAELLTGGDYGTVSLAADGSFTYTPDAGFAGTDAFTYRVTDGQAYSGVVTVSVVVRDVKPPAPPPPAPPPVVPPPAEPVPSPVPPVAPRFGPQTAEVAPATVDVIPQTSVPVTATPVPVGVTTPVSATDAAPRVNEAGRVHAPAPRPAMDAGGPVAVNAAPAAPPVEPQTAPTPRAVAPTPAAPPEQPTPPPPAAVTVVAPPLPAAAAVVQFSSAESLPSEAVFAGVDQAAADLRTASEERGTTDTLVVTGSVAVAGYVLLNTRAVYWFLSALLARPAVWRRFDPLDVIYAWERDRDGRPAVPDPDADSTLASIVD